MRILHTADWHLGRIFYADYLTDEQAHVIEHHFLPLVKEARIDAVVIAGDVYDRAVPPVEAVALWDMTITKLVRDCKVPTFVIAGNHDSGMRLEAGRDLWEASGLYLWGTLRRLAAPVVLEDEYGKVAFCPMPFSEPKSIAAYMEERRPPEDDGETGTSDACLTGYDEGYRCWGQYWRQAVPSDCRSVAIAHAFVSGGLASESERPLVIGGSYAVSAAAFAGFTYTALGHLHRPQRAGSEAVRYSGSLLPYSFDEAGHQKSMTVVDIDGAGRVQTEQIVTPIRRGVRVVEGDFQSILADEELHRQCGDDYVAVRLTDTAPVIDGLARLRNVIPHVMTLEPVGRMAVADETAAEPTFRRLSERDLFAQFAVAARGKALTEQERQYMDTLWNRIRKEEP